MRPQRQAWSPDCPSLNFILSLTKTLCETLQCRAYTIPAKCLILHDVNAVIILLLMSSEYSKY